VDRSATNILIIEDDDILGALVQRHLQESDFAAEWAQTAGDGWSRLQNQSYDVVVLDIMLPDEDGLSLCRRIRKTSEVPIIMVTAKGETSDRIHGLEIGADDYLPKPFSLWELEARINAILRRAKKTDPEIEQKRNLGKLIVDLDAHVVELSGISIELTRSEFDLLERLTSRPGAVFSREQLLDCIKGGETDAFDRAVDTHISNLRKKIETDPAAPTFIKTVWGMGYKFEVS